MAERTTRLATLADVAAIGNLAEQSGLFPAEAAESICAPAWQNGSEDLWLVSEHVGNIIGFVFIEAERMTDRAWNMRALAVSPASRRLGVARDLVEAAEQKMRDRAARLMIVDTTDTDDQTGARAFYEALGHEAVATVPDFFSDGESKVTFVKKLDATGQLGGG